MTTVTFTTDFGDGSSASAHATEYVIHESWKEYIVTTDESGGGLAGDAAGVCAQRTYARIIDMATAVRAGSGARTCIATKRRS